MDLNKLKGSVITIGGANIIVVDAVLGTETIKVSGDNGKTYSISVLIKNGTIVLDDSVKAEVIKCIDELVAAANKAKEEEKARKKAEAEAAKKAHEEVLAKAKELVASGMNISDVITETGITENEAKDIYKQVHGNAKVVNYPTSRLKAHGLVYWVFQGDHYEQESAGNYVFAPVYNNEGDEIHTYYRLTELRPGDVLLHARGGYINAISIVQDRYSMIDHDIYTMEKKPCRKVPTKYTLLANPLKHGNYKNEIKAICAGLKYAPFDKNGDGNQGYLYEIPYKLSQIFLKEIIVDNPGIASNPSVQEILSITI